MNELLFKVYEGSGIIHLIMFSMITRLIFVKKNDH